MDSESVTIARSYLAQSRDILSASLANEALVAGLVEIADAITASLTAGGKLLIAGNGGSAADAQHIAGEFLSRLNFDRAPLPAIALTVDTSVLTAVGNDYGYEEVFRRQVLGLGRPGDVLIGISTSGRSPNILRALEAGREKKLVTVGFTGANAESLQHCCDHVLAAPSASTPLIQQLHITAAHIICSQVERAIFQRDAN